MLPTEREQRMLPYRFMSELEAFFILQVTQKELMALSWVYKKWVILVVSELIFINFAVLFSEVFELD